MFKFVVDKSNGSFLIRLGFVDGNFEKLKAGKPIMIYYGELKKSWPGGLLVSYPSPELKAVRSRIPKAWKVIEVGDEEMLGMREGKVGKIEIASNREVAIFWGKDEDSIKNMLSAFIDVKTEIITPTVRDGQHKFKAF